MAVSRGLDAVERLENQKKVFPAPVRFRNEYWVREVPEQIDQRDSFGSG